MPRPWRPRCSRAEAVVVGMMVENDQRLGVARHVRGITEAVEVRRVESQRRPPGCSRSPDGRKKREARQEARTSTGGAASASASVGTAGIAGLAERESEAQHRPDGSRRQDRTCPHTTTDFA